MSYKQLEVIRGFLCHLLMTYSIVTPYRKCFHLMLVAHHPRGNVQGWKLSPRAWEAYMWGQESEGRLSEEEAQSFLEVGQEVAPPKQKSKVVPTLTTSKELPKLVRHLVVWDLKALLT
jgi:hypothetical protein